MLDRLACASGRNDEEANLELAREICLSGNAEDIKQLVAGLDNRSKVIVNDCIKVLYEIGASRPELIDGYAEVLIRHLQSRNNRLVWGCMTALDSICEENPQTIFQEIPTIIAAYENGSVITRDHSISVFAKLCRSAPEYEEQLFPLLLNHLKTCRPKELAQHAERASVCVSERNKSAFAAVLEDRAAQLTNAQQTRINKLLRKLRTGTA